MIKTDKVIYHTKTQEEYDWLMDGLDDADCEWQGGGSPISGKEVCDSAKSDSYILIEGKTISFSGEEDYFYDYYEGNYEIIEVSDLMNQPYKDTKGKPKLSLVPPQVLFDIAEVREYGNAKYPADGADNWKRVDINDYKDALLRHTMKYIQNPKGKDEESGIEHYKHMACNIAFICEMERKDEKNWDMQDLR